MTGKNLNKKTWLVRSSTGEKLNSKNGKKVNYKNGKKLDW